MGVAEIILQQLGGGRSVAMTGVHNLCSHKNTFSMSLPRNKSRANQLHIWRKEAIRTAGRANHVLRRRVL